MRLPIVENSVRGEGKRTGIQMRQNCIRLPPLKSLPAMRGIQDSSFSGLLPEKRHAKKKWESDREQLFKRFEQSLYGGTGTVPGMAG